MAIVNDFELWLEGADLEDYHEVYYLYKSVEELQEWGAFRCTEKITSKGKMYFVYCKNISDPLHLASDKARDYFLKYIEKQYTGEMDIEEWYCFKENCEKKD
jgi:hypothetical protein